MNDNRFNLSLFVAPAFVIYIFVLFILLLAEIGLPPLAWLRATNQVLFISALIFLPFFLLSFSDLVKSLTFRVSGQEIHLELGKFRQDVSLDIKNVQNYTASSISNSEEALWPLLTGYDVSSEERLTQEKLVIGSKFDPSQTFFAYLLKYWIEATIPGVSCEVKIANGGSIKNFADLRFGWIDMYVDFTGTCCQFFNLDCQKRHSLDVLEDLNKKSKSSIGICFLSPFGATEDYCIVARKNVAQEYNLQAIKDLEWVSSQLVFSGDPEFLNRKDCYLGLISRYALNFKNLEVCSVTDRYRFIKSGSSDLSVGYETDPELRSPDFVVLDDSESFFPSYHAVPVVRLQALNKISGLETSLSSLENSVSTEDLKKIVYQVKGTTSLVAEHLARNFVSRKLNRRV